MAKNPAPLPAPSVALEHEKYEAFATYVADGENAATAYRKAFTDAVTNTNSHRVSASNLRKRPAVAQRIKYLEDMRRKDDNAFLELRDARDLTLTANKIVELMRFAGDCLREAAELAEGLGAEGRTVSRNIRTSLGIHTSRALKVGGDDQQNKSDEGYEQWSHLKRCSCG